MSEFKIAGACTLCDAMCFEVTQVWQAHERYPDEPKRLGPPLDGAMRVEFLLFDGTKMTQTFCAACAILLSSENYIEMWRKNLRSWLREISGNRDRHSAWFPQQFANGFLCELRRTKWTEINLG